MNTKNNVQEQDPIFQRIAMINFGVYLFFVTFGTGIPFYEREVMDQIDTTNPVNQVVFSSLFIISIICIIPKWKSLFILIRSEKFLSLYLIWALVTLLWAKYPMVSFKRWFSLLASYSTIAAIFLHTNSSEDIFRIFKIIFYLYVPLSILSVLFIPAAIDPDFNTWRGFAVTKNFLGQAALICVLIWANAIGRDHFLHKKIISFTLLILSVLLLFGSMSMTSILTFLGILYIYTLFTFNKFFHSLRIGRIFSTFIIVFSLAIFLIIYKWGNFLIEEGFRIIGKDPSFTGRTDLWLLLLTIGKPHLLLGYGFANFWVMSYDNIDLMLVYDKFIWLPNEAHLGYLDIVLGTGFVGLGIFLVMLLYYFINLFKLQKMPFTFWIAITTLVLNLQESTLFSPRVLTGELFLFSYLALFGDMIHKNKMKNV